MSWALLRVPEATIARTDMSSPSWGSHGPAPRVEEGVNIIFEMVSMCIVRKTKEDRAVTEARKDRAGSPLKEGLSPRASQRRWPRADP